MSQGLAGSGLPPPQSLLEGVLDCAPVALVGLDLDGTVSFAGGSALDVPLDQILGRRMTDLSESEAQTAAVRRALAGEDVDLLSVWGGRFWNARFRALLGPDGGRSGVVGVFTDVTEQVAAQHAVERREAFLNAVIDATHEALVVLDAEDRVLMANSRCERLFGRPIGPGSDWFELFRFLAADPMPEPCREDRPQRLEVRLQPDNGSPVWVLASTSPLRDTEGSFLGCVTVLTDITGHKQTQSLLQAVALSDPLTGVGNRTALTDRLRSALDRHRLDRRAGAIAVLFCDVDGLKVVNDRLGHAVGDGMLQTVADRIAHAVRPDDTVARFGGDEFVVLCESLHDPDEAARLAERIRQAVRAPMTVQDSTLSVTVSIGVALSRPYGTLDELLAAADGAAYQAKRLGRDRVELAEG